MINESSPGTQIILAGNIAQPSAAERADPVGFLFYDGKFAKKNPACGRRDLGINDS
jgi:hypothetical protein